MLESFASPGVQPCIWMSAGLLSYKLCDRCFDCDHCPLDAALRGEAKLENRDHGQSPAGTPPIAFPQELSYSPGHTWIREIGEEHRVLMFGLDSFAASLIGPVRKTTCARPGSLVRRGERVCQFDLRPGLLGLCAPVPGRILQGNPDLLSHPEWVIEDPYGRGWILRIEPEHRAQAVGLMGSEEALAKTRVDLQRFRRKVAQYLLEEVDTVGPSLQDGGLALTDLRLILGGRRYLDLLKELVH